MACPCSWLQYTLAGPGVTPELLTGVARMARGGWTVHSLHPANSNLSRVPGSHTRDYQTSSNGVGISSCAELRALLNFSDVPRQWARFISFPRQEFRRRRFRPDWGPGDQTHDVHAPSQRLIDLLVAKNTANAEVPRPTIVGVSLATISRLVLATRRIAPPPRSYFSRGCVRRVGPKCRGD